MTRPQTQGEAIAVLSTQMLQLHTDVDGLRKDLEDHRKEHRAETRAGQASRRRLWTAVVVLIAGIDGPLLAILLSRR